MFHFVIPKVQKEPEIQQNTENLERLWMLAEEEIRKKELCTCPVCKSKFKNMEELLVLHPVNF